MEKILVVDDEDFSTQIIDFFLKTNGFEVVTCTDPNKAAEMLKSTHYDLLVTDWMMPVLAGDQLIEKVRENSLNPDMPIVVTTAKAVSLDEREFILKNKGFILSKPFTPPQLLNKVTEALT